MITHRIMNAGIYVRVSTERQVKEGFSVSAQKENLIQFVKQQGWNIFDIYADEGISGKNIKDRPDVRRLIHDIQLKHVDVVVIYKMDRFSRSARDMEDFMDMMKETGVQVFTLSDGNVDVSTASGRFNVRIKGAVAQLEREQTIERVKVAFIQKVKQGKSLCSSTPSYGYDRPKHQEIQTINKEEAIIVKRIFKMYVEGKSFTEIAHILNAEGIPTKKKGKIQKRRGSGETYCIKGVWQAKTIRLILSNITYIGGVRYGIHYDNGFEELNGLHKAIISKKLWNQAQERLNKIKHVSKTNYPRESVYYCGTLVCGLCGKKLTTQRTIKKRKDGTKKIYYSYRCTNREIGLCSALGMSHKKVEKAFLNYLEQIEKLNEFDYIHPFQEREDDFIKEGQLKKRIREFENKRKDVMNLFMENEIEYSQFHYMLNELDKKLKILGTELCELEKNYQPKKNFDKSKISKNIKDHWKYLSDRERLEFLTQFIKKIMIVNESTDKINGPLKILNVDFYE